MGHRCKSKNISEEKLMRINYTKAILYAFYNIEAVKEQIDEIVEKKALASMTDCSPCDEQCEKILTYMAQKVALVELKNKIKLVLRSLTDYELDILDYKYFKQKPKEYFANFDTEGRTYFRQQSNLIKKGAALCEMVGISNEWFEKNFLEMNFFKQLLKRVDESQPKPKKTKIKSVIKKTQEKQQKAVSDFMLIA